MSHYRFYAIKRDGHIDGLPTEHELPDDVAALTEAKRRINGHDIEVWQGERMVAYLTPDEK